ncbi:ribonuclease H-like domain-containing protein [Bipolaris maydis]|nr:ribonuclease H-like domain-containing protein [Bipolaris maydis]
MDVDAATFPHHLLWMLINIAEADFVSFDLELSGIPSRIQDKPPRGPGRFTMEERYAETKMGADRYQILQVGITCARFDYIADKYVLRPYNIDISPLFDERIDFEREIRFQSGACTFLLKNGFDLGLPFANGVQYLSRQEAEKARQMACDRLEKKNPVPDLHLKEGDVESLDFMRRVREAINKWKTTTSSGLDITTHTGLPDRPKLPVITRFEKRLVHQLVRAEFPDLVTMGRSECVRIIHLDPVREAENMQRMKNRVDESILRQTGFRWIFEALVKGGNLSRTDLLFVARTTGDQDTLDDFQDVIHELFPKIIDTKYLATFAEGDLNASPTLQDIAQGLSSQPLPDIITHADHPKYQDIEAFHEAGYDSLLTATIMIKLAARLGVERGEKILPPLLQNLTNGADSRSNLTTNENVPDFVKDGREKVERPIPLPPVENPEAKQSKKQRKKNKQANKKAGQTRFQTKNVFDALSEMSLNPDTTPLSTDDEEAEPMETKKDYQNGKLDEQTSQSPGSWENATPVQNTTGWAPLEQVERQPMELIPHFDSKFWAEFGNTLRVFGTEEAVWKIATWES